MVRTRSGKSTTQAEKKEEKKAQLSAKQSETPANPKPTPASPLNVGISAIKKVLSPLVSPFKNPFVSTIPNTIKKSVPTPSPAPLSTLLNSPFAKLASPIKSPSRMPRVPKLAWHLQLAQDLTVWKPTEKTFTLWACLVALAVLVMCCDSVYWQIGVKYPEFHFLAVVLFIHAVDVLTNFLNEFKGGWDVAIFFTEAAVNASEALLFINIMNGSSYLCVMTMMIGTFNVLSLNIGYKDEDRLWVRAMAYAVLGVCFAIFADFVNSARLVGFVSTFTVAMVLDMADFPDKWVGLRMCEGLVILCRSIGVYMLITADLLKDSKLELTTMEQQLKAMIGQ